jgi:hypothetical protein
VSTLDCLLGVIAREVVGNRDDGGGEKWDVSAADGNKGFGGKADDRAETSNVLG